MGKNYTRDLEAARSLADIFEVVKVVVMKGMGQSRAGLMLGMANLGNSPDIFLGAFYPEGSNVIVMNKIPLQRIKETRPELYKPYAFMVLMHEYIHTLGFTDEAAVRAKVRDLTRSALGDDHLATMMADDTRRFFNHLVYPGTAWQAEDGGIELVKGFDRSSVCYIA